MESNAVMTTITGHPLDAESKPRLTFLPVEWLSFTNQMVSLQITSHRGYDPTLKHFSESSGGEVQPTQSLANHLLLVVGTTVPLTPSVLLRRMVGVSVM